MISRLVACALLLVAFTACDTPYKKKDEEEKKPMKDQSGDQSFKAFLGRLRIAVGKHDTDMMASMMTPDFGYRWDDAPPGETAFMYWDKHNLWGELSNTLQQRFGANERYMVAPMQAITDAKYTGYRVGMRTVRGSWRFAYLCAGRRLAVNGQDPIACGLPHREPFMFIGSVVEVQPGESAVCEKAFPPEEPFFRGHFPGDPLVPGVIIAEALAQTAGIAAGQPGRGFHLTAIKGMKFLRPVRPGDVLALHARKIATVGGLWQFEVSARVAGETVAEGVVVLSEA